jgi:hypothetical protein
VSPSTNTSTPILEGYDDYGCEVNAIGPADLFARYADAGFLYPAKLDRLQPVMDEITENWRRALRAGELIHWVATHESAHLGSWASISSWRSTHHGWVTQHLVSIGGPIGSRAVLLAGQAVRIRDGIDRSHQSWFRPENRFPNRVFGSVTGGVGLEHASVVPYSLLAFPRRHGTRLGSHLPVTEITAEGEVDLFSLASRARGHVYAQAEELDHRDLLLETVDELYANVGLRRYRRIFVAWDGHEPLGAAIAYRGPLGFNFSFLENRCDLVVEPRLPEPRVAMVVQALIAAAVGAYEDFRPSEIPFVVGEREADAARAAGAMPVRRYSQSIWLRPGFEAMYQHMAGFYDRIIRAHRRCGLGHQELIRRGPHA